MQEYVSPFKLPVPPPKAKCSRPRDHKLWPSMHECADGSERLWGPKCPVHYIDYRLPPRNAWNMWYEAREQFATEEDEVRRANALAEMLNHVTESNPPDAPKLPDRVPLYANPYYWLGALAVIIAVLILAVL